MSALHAQPLRIVEKRQGNTASAPADLERMSGPSMSGHLKCLESAGWITRDAAVMRDRRCARLPLTATGLAAQNATRQRRHDWFAERIEGSSTEWRAALSSASAVLRQLAEDR